jgi:hypothetical protein
VLMAAVMVLTATSPAMAIQANSAPVGARVGAPESISLADGVYSESVMQNQLTVISVGEFPDPKFATGGQSGTVTPTIREVVLGDRDGNKQTLTLGKEVKNFSQIKEGDTVTFKEEKKIAIFIGKEGTVPGMGDSTMKFSAPMGSKPGYIEVQKEFVTLEIMKLDAGKKEVTVRLPDNTIKTVNTPRLDFSSVKVGQNVIVMKMREQSIVVADPFAVKAP